MENPSPFYTFRPVELDAAAEARAIAALNKNPPEMVVLLSRDVREYGFRGFGIDYGRDLVDWVRAGYEPVRSWGFRQFGLNLFRRRPTPKDPRSSG